MRKLAEEMCKEIYDGQLIEELIPIFEKYLVKAMDLGIASLNEALGKTK